jgi:hypothetical protein
MSQELSATIIRVLLLPQRWIYRVSQFARGLLAYVKPDEMLVVTEVLPKAAVALFVEMPLDAQRHSLNVLYSLRKQAGKNGTVHPSLEAAGLLHDVGKIAADRAGQGIQLWLRGPLVLTEAVAAGWMDRMAAPKADSGWRYTLYVHREHPAIGAQMAAKAGCDELTCWLIAHHQDTPLALKQQAQEASPSDPVMDDMAISMLAALRRADQRN